MNIFQQKKALNYALFFLRDEINTLKETLKTANDPLTRPHLERRLKELEEDYDMFEKLDSEYSDSFLL